jgi:hypothetical protein
VSSYTGVFDTGNPRVRDRPVDYPRDGVVQVTDCWMRRLPEPEVATVFVRILREGVTDGRFDLAAPFRGKSRGSRVERILTAGYETAMNETRSKPAYGRVPVNATKVASGVSTFQAAAAAIICDEET